MYPYIKIFDSYYSSYGLLVTAGIIAGFLYFVYRRSNFDISVSHEALIIIFGGLGAFLGSKILYIVIVWQNFITDLQYFSIEPDVFLQAYLGSGFMFYGGVYGAIGAIALYCHLAKIDVWETARLFMPCLPLFHVFGRIGCFMAGCCYGIESEQFGMTFANSLSAPNNVPLVPVQLIEAGCEAILFLIMWQMSLEKGSGRKVFTFWLIAYGAIRFILEFFRGDEIRGFIGPISTSQIIGIMSILFGFMLLFWNPENWPSFSFTNKKKEHK